MAIISGGSLLGLGVTSAVVFTFYMVIPRTEGQILQAFSESKDQGRHMWTYGVSDSSGEPRLFHYFNPLKPKPEGQQKVTRTRINPVTNKFPLDNRKVPQS